MTAVGMHGAHRSRSVGRVLGRVVGRVLDGEHVWGTVTVRPVSRTLWSSRRLVLYPPGTNRRERQVLRLWAAMPVLAPMLVVVAMAVCAGTPAWIGLCVGVVVALTACAVVGVACRRLRVRMRALTVTTFLGGPEPEVHGDAELMARLMDVLTALEEARRLGAVDAVEFELAWAAAYRAVPSRAGT
jgi:hypothetical protein